MILLFGRHGVIVAFDNGLNVSARARTTRVLLLCIVRIRRRYTLCVFGPDIRKKQNEVKKKKNVLVPILITFL